MNFLLLVVIISLSVYIFFSDEIKAIKERDPAAKNSLEIILLYSGLHAIVMYRIAHRFWEWKLPFFPRALPQFAKFLTGIEIHPGATIGKGLFIDHGSGVVIGETSIVGSNVTLFQGVTLGGTGKETGKHGSFHSQSLCAMRYITIACRPEYKRIISRLFFAAGSRSLIALISSEKKI